VASPASSAPRSVEAGATGASTTNATRPSGEVIAVTIRDDFLLELGEALGGTVTVHPVDSLAAALEHAAGSRRLTLLVIDARDASDLRADVDCAHSQAPSAPVLVFAPLENEKSVASALKGSNIFAVLPIPVDKRKTTAVFDGALAEAAAKRGGARGAQRAEHAGEIRFEAPRPPLTPEPISLGTTSPFGESGASWYKSKLAFVGAAVAVALAAGALYFLTHGTSSKQAPKATAAQSTASEAQSTVPAAAPSTPAPAAPAALVKGNVDDLLEKARAAMREHRYTEPASDNALLYYRSVLGADVDNGEARDGMTRLAALLATRLEDSLASEHYDDAASALAAWKIAAPKDARIPPLETRLLQAQFNTALAEGNLERATAITHQAMQLGTVPGEQLAKWRAELARHQDDARLKRVADLIAMRIHDNHLLEPENDSAKFYFEQLKGQAGAASPEVRNAAHDLVAAYLRRAREAALGGHTSDAERWVTEARATGMSAADLASYQRDLTAARQHAQAAESERLVQLVHDRIREGHLAEPSQDSASFYLSQLADGYGDNAVVSPLSHDLATHLVERAIVAAGAGQSAQADADLALAKHWGADPQTLQAVQQMGAGKAGAATVGAQVPAGYRPKRTRYFAPEYPDQAIEKHLQGSVTVEFTVDVNGQPRDAHVIESNPPHVFDRAALTAITRWRFEPLVINKVPTAVPTRTVIRFELPK